MVSLLHEFESKIRLQIGGRSFTRIQGLLRYQLNWSKKYFKHQVNGTDNSINRKWLARKYKPENLGGIICYSISKD